jgi:hypothetical protein
MKALLRQTAIVVLIALTLSHVYEALAYAANGRTDIPVCPRVSVLVTQSDRQECLKFF